MDHPRSLFDADTASQPPATPAPLENAPDGSSAEPLERAARPRLVARALDLTRGAPAAGMPITFDAIAADGSPTPLGAEVSDADGRASPPGDHALEVNYYRVTFNTAHYFGLHGVDSCYPVVGVVVRVTDTARDFEVPLLFSASGFSTYHA